MKLAASSNKRQNSPAFFMFIFETYSLRNPWLKVDLKKEKSYRDVDFSNAFQFNLCDNCAIIAAKITCFCYIYVLFYANFGGYYYYLEQFMETLTVKHFQKSL